MLHAWDEKYKITKYKGKRPLKIPMHTWEDNIKMHPKEDIRISTRSIYRDEDRRRALMNKFSGSTNGEEFLE
jgi:hypothetical protein